MVTRRSPRIHQAFGACGSEKLQLPQKLFGEDAAIRKYLQSLEADGSVGDFAARFTEVESGRCLDEARLARASEKRRVALTARAERKAAKHRLRKLDQARRDDEFAQQLLSRLLDLQSDELAAQGHFLEFASEGDPDVSAWSDAERGKLHVPEVECDLDRDQQRSKQEWIRCLQFVPGLLEQVGLTWDEWLSDALDICFEEIDVDHNGLLSWREVRRWLQNIQDQEPMLPQGHALPIESRQLIREAISDEHCGALEPGDNDCHDERGLLQDEIAAQQLLMRRMSAEAEQLQCFLASEQEKNVCSRCDAASVALLTTLACLRRVSASVVDHVDRLAHGGSPTAARRSSCYVLSEIVLELENAAHVDPRLGELASLIPASAHASPYTLRRLPHLHGSGQSFAKQQTGESLSCQARKPICERPSREQPRR